MRRARQGVAPASERLEIGNQPIEDIIRLADRLLKVDTSVSPKTEPGIIVHRSDRSYRIAAHQGRLRLGEVLAERHEAVVCPG